MNAERGDAYQDHFSSSDAAAAYDEVEYAPGSYSSLLWEIEELHLRSLLSDPSFVPRREAYLDFACGTGRVTAALAPFFQTVTGYDTSEAMLARARTRIPAAHLVGAEVGDQPPISGSFDLVTAFRFVLNAAPAKRLESLQWIRRLLRDAHSRVVVNNHGNLVSHKLALHLVPWLRRRHRPRPLTGNVMSHGEVVQLAAEAGFEIDTRLGGGLLGGRLARVIGTEAVRRVELLGARHQRLARMGVDQLYVLRPV